MRGDLEAVLSRYRELEELLARCQTAANAHEYRRFWQELKGQNREIINRTANYMARRANR